MTDSTHSGGRHRSRRAFSLLEMALVVVIIAILAAIAAPRYSSGMADYRAEYAARRIVADLSLAQARAKALSAGQTVTFNQAANQYQIVGMADPDRPASTYCVCLGDAPYEAAIVTAALGGDATIVFNGYGIPDSGGTIVLQAGTARKTITIDADTGTATIQ